MSQTSPSSLDIWIRWGKEHLLNGTVPRDAVSEQDFNLSRKDIGPNDLDKQFTTFSTQIHEAVEELKAELTLDIEPQMANPDHPGHYFYNYIRQYIHNLDQLIYLNHALHHFGPITQNHDLQEKARRLVDYIIEADLPTHRLIPLNFERRKALSIIPESYHYFFPWYSLWSDLPENALTLIVKRLIGNPTNMLDDDLRSLWNEIQTDEPLYDQITGQVAATKNQAINKFEEQFDRIAAENPGMIVSVTGASPLSCSSWDDTIPAVDVAAIKSRMPIGLHLAGSAQDFSQKNSEETIETAIFLKNGDNLHGPLRVTTTLIYKNKNENRMTISGKIDCPDINSLGSPLSTACFYQEISNNLVKAKKLDFAWQDKIFTAVFDSSKTDEDFILNFVFHFEENSGEK